MRGLGYFLLGIGAVGLFYTFNLDTSVLVGLTGQRVQNLGLMQERQTHLFFALATVLIGVLLIVADKLRETGESAEHGEEAIDQHRTCPHCAERIRTDAVVCRYCRLKVLNADSGFTEDTLDIPPNGGSDDSSQVAFRELAQAAAKAERAFKKRT